MHILLSYLDAELFVESRQQLVHAGVDLVAREGVIGRSERESERDALRSFADTVARVNIEEFDIFEQFARALADNFLDFADFELFVADECEIA